ncbi:helix-turn-helix transcriptional regulator [Curtobacterium sp. ISL-83]|uniref:helix-turn-helix domain-containing protein n=1 Tax=Curtobacterium sp. ISL-83 TaxID=2819145 RepID=UPI001BEB40BA|nr:helix-turn-helix transcriptional regulator [Curtobacterium sp. ISL-83]MBT2503492.1 helix-turn-helix transcriptional regulator [Curtobacterium sp. ISL-83]
MNDASARLDARADALLDTTSSLLRGLVELRHKHRLTQAEVAERMGVSQPAVAKFERYDANPTQTTIQRYAMAVGARIKVEIIDDCEDEQVSPDRISQVVNMNALGTWSRAREVSTMSYSTEYQVTRV